MAADALNRREFMALTGAALAGTHLPQAEALLSKPLKSDTAPVNAASARVITYPAPEGEILSSDYIVEVDGKQVPVYVIQSGWHDKKYSAAYFDFSGTVTVRIRPNLSALGVTASLDRLAVRPEKYGIRPTIENGVATFTTDKHFNISFEPAGQHSPLHLFSNPLEENPPKPGDPGVVYFGPGIHTPTHIHLTAGQTLYIAGGAVVNAGVTSEGDNIRIMGRGILSGNNWPQAKGPTLRMIQPCDGRNILIEDIVIRGSWTWTVVPTRCDQVSIRNLRICGSRFHWDDGIDPCNSSNVTIRDCFIHTDDDGVCVKGMAVSGESPRSSENILVEGCTFWIDFANGFRIGCESSARACRNFTARDIDFIHFRAHPYGVPPGLYGAIFLIQPRGNMPMENLAFEDIRINGEQPLMLIEMNCADPHEASEEVPGSEPDLPIVIAERNMAHEESQIPGKGPYIHNVTYTNVNVYGHLEEREPAPVIALDGVDKEHDIQNVVLENVMMHGRQVTAKTPGLHLGEFVSGVVFK